MMPIFVPISKEMTEWYYQGFDENPPPFSERTFDDLRMWVGFKQEIKDWIIANITQRSAVKVRSTVTANDIAYTASFKSEKDAILFKMYWG